MCPQNLRTYRTYQNLPEPQNLPRTRQNLQNLLLAGMIIMGPIRAHGARRRFDLFGFGFLAMALVAGLTALSNGQDKG